MKDVRSVVAACFCLIAFAFGLSPTSARADDYSDVAQLLKSGRYADALTRAEQFLSSNSKDASMRFMRGVALAENGKASEATNVFSRLTDEFPDLPEPYNNLAVLYAAQGQFDRARSTLEAAIKTNPSYSTAYENLGDVYARLANQAYAKALQLDASNAAAGARLGLIRELAPASAYRLPRVVPPSTSVAAATASPAAPAQAAPTKPAPPVQVAQAPAQPTPAPSSKPAPAAISSPPAAMAVPAAGSKPQATGPVTSAAAPKPEPAPSKPQPSESASSKDVESAVRAWAAAWSAKDVRGYLAAYGKEFNPPGNTSRSAWEDERKQRITSKGSISVKIDGLRVNVDGNRATAKFRQDYKSGGLSVSSRKTLELQKSGDKWKIIRESVGG